MFFVQTNKTKDTGQNLWTELAKDCDLQQRRVIEFKENLQQDYQMKIYLKLVL